MSFNNPFASAKKPANSSDNSILDDTDDEVIADNPTDDDSPVFRRAPASQQSSSLPTSQPTTGLPTTAGASAPRHISGAGANNMFSALMEDDDDDDEGVPFIRKNSENNPNGGHTLPDEDVIIKVISEKQKELRKKYPTGGIKTSRFVTADILLKAPEKYFEKYYNEVSEGVKYVRNHLTEGGRSEIIRDAQDHPTDDAYQDEAYYIVSSIASEFMQRSMWRDTHKAIILSFICNEIVGFGRLDPLWRDSKITEIICNGPKDIQVEIKGEIYKVESIAFDSQAHIMELIERLYRAIGKNPSQTNPLLIGRLHDRSRIFVTHPSVNPDGPNFTIRRHPRGYWIPEALVERGAASDELMSYIGNIVYKGGSLILSGGTHSGKTSMLNALTGFYKPKVRVLTIESNLEMKPNPKKLLGAAMECRDPSPDRPGDRGVTMRDLVKATMQMRPDTIVVGEVTDDAAYDLCQALNTGHAGASTVHANGPAQTVTRLTSLIAQGGLVTTEGALDLIASAFDIIISVKHFPVDGSRRIVSVDEIGTVPIEVDGRLTLPTHQLWRFVDEGLDENGKVTGFWEQVGDISDQRKENKNLNLEADLTWDELKELSSLPADKERA